MTSGWQEKSEDCRGGGGDLGWFQNPRYSLKERCGGYHGGTCHSQPYQVVTESFFWLQHHKQVEQQLTAPAPSYIMRPPPARSVTTDKRQTTLLDATIFPEYVFLPPTSSTSISKQTHTHTRKKHNSKQRTKRKVVHTADEALTVIM